MERKKSKKEIEVLEKKKNLMSTGPCIVKEKASFIKSEIDYEQNII